MPFSLQCPSCLLLFTIQRPAAFTIQRPACFQLQYFFVTCPTYRDLLDSVTQLSRLAIYPTHVFIGQITLQSICPQPFQLAFQSHFLSIFCFTFMTWVSTQIQVQLLDFSTTARLLCYFFSTSMYYALTTQSMKHFFFHSVERRPFYISVHVRVCDK